MQNAVSLKPYNTFGIDVKAARFTEISNVEELKLVLRDQYHTGDPLLILGGGSNVLFSGDFNGLVIRNKIGGIDIIREDSDYIYVRAGAGIVWHQFVLYCIEGA